MSARFSKGFNLIFMANRFLSGTLKSNTTCSGSASGVFLESARFAWFKTANHVAQIFQDLDLFYRVGRGLKTLCPNLKTVLPNADFVIEG